ncbi:LacI family DNA-binding transcriptional regulator [Gottschalkiaceae bacterium SANA]|nr:LacI family DNA-binding transcriptional regulator [Gottschalkiaceae bacterium SANA]
MAPITIKDVAKIAGVSARTVSRVINQDENVSDRTRKRVLEVVEETGFRVNLLAQSLRNKKTGILFAFVSEKDNAFLGEFHNVTIQYLNEEARKLGYKMIVSQSNADRIKEDQHDGFYLLTNGYADGAVIFDTKDVDERLTYLIEKQIPFVVVGKDKHNSESSYVNLDNYRAGYMGAEHLIQQGYKKIRFFLGSKNYTVNEDRSKGYLDALKAKKMKVIPIDYGIINPETAYDKMKEILSTDQWPDAVFVSGDMRAMGVYHAIYEKGLKIPQDIAVLGIDDIPMAQFSHPPLSSINQFPEKMAVEAIRLLNEQIENGEVGRGEHVIFDPELKVRQSTTRAWIDKNF